MSLFAVSVEEPYEGIGRLVMFGTYDEAMTMAQEWYTDGTEADDIFVTGPFELGMDFSGLEVEKVKTSLSILMGDPRAIARRKKALGL